MIRLSGLTYGLCYTKDADGVLHPLAEINLLGNEKVFAVAADSGALSSAEEPVIFTVSANTEQVRNLRDNLSDLLARLESEEPPPLATAPPTPAPTSGSDGAEAPQVSLARVRAVLRERRVSLAVVAGLVKRFGPIVLEVIDALMSSSDSVPLPPSGITTTLPK